MKLRPLSPGLLVANGLALIVFLYFCSWVWAPRGQEGLLGGPGDPIIFCLTALPVLVLALVFNVVWLIVIFSRARRIALWRSMALLLLTIAMWAASIAYDRSRMRSKQGLPAGWCPAFGRIVYRAR
jgi:hypothetical protein